MDAIACSSGADMSARLDSARSERSECTSLGHSEEDRGDPGDSSRVEPDGAGKAAEEIEQGLSEPNEAAVEPLTVAPAGGAPRDIHRRAEIDVGAIELDCFFRSVPRRSEAPVTAAAAMVDDDDALMETLLAQMDRLLPIVVKPAAQTSKHTEPSVSATQDGPVAAPVAAAVERTPPASPPPPPPPTMAAATDADAAAPASASAALESGAALLDALDGHISTPHPLAAPPPGPRTPPRLAAEAAAARKCGAKSTSGAPFVRWHARGKAPLSSRMASVECGTHAGRARMDE